VIILEFLRWLHDRGARDIRAEKQDVQWRATAGNVILKLMHVYAPSKPEKRRTKPEPGSDKSVLAELKPSPTLFLLTPIRVGANSPLYA